jgi:hypothetical protein
MQKSQVNLQDQLESYSVASKALRMPDILKSGGSMLATVAGSALALATNANAAIIYSGPQNITVSRPAGSGVSQAGFAVGGASWRVWASNFNAGTNNQARAALIRFAAGERFMNASSTLINAKKLASGAVISAGQAFWSGGGGADLRRKNNNAPLYGQFLNSSIGFVGIKFKISGSYHFGWIRAHANIGPSNAVSASVIDWAYNDVAGASIKAGEGIAPEPSTTAMALLAAGAAGVLAWRKRRKRAEAAA